MITDALDRITPHVWQLRFPGGHVYLVALPDGGFAAVDTGLPGSAPAILDALAALGGRPEALRQIVLTHCHMDHMGSAADLVAATGARVLAGALDAPYISGTLPEPPADLPPPPGERALHERTLAGIAAGGVPPLRHTEVDRPLHDGDTLDDRPEPVRVLHVPGHTPGAIALHLPESRLLLPGDAIAADPTGARAVLAAVTPERDWREAGGASTTRSPSRSPNHHPNHGM
ncbi:MBL fold metallo-hydrolase [Streptomyces noursei]|uniref:MBL fold metallo-hydrolase n=1 Tax=Streptomyces noursei TaxID=1971 RepID=UPI001F03BCE3|nr:MBL fold metallo-hydrolase [Streptomyces noursei]